MSLASQSFPLDKSGITGYVYLVSFFSCVGASLVSPLLTASHFRKRRAALFFGRRQTMKLMIVFPLLSSIYLYVHRQDIIVLFELVVKGRDHAIGSNAG